ncbi:MAG: hypothetical protein LBK65_07505 [Tannerellaceae bacterium]|nr:hypothetical protein [Tannerellaceae bacterium]
MSTEKITKSFLFYVVPLCLLLSYIFVTCYGEEFDIIENRLNNIEAQLTDIQDKINGGYIVKSVENASQDGRNGFRITFVGPNGDETHTILSGATGAAGADGHDGMRWMIENGMWVSYDWNSTRTEWNIPATPRSPEIQQGYWVFYTNWDQSCTCYDTVRTNLAADSLATYIVDHGQYYDLFVPVQKEVGGVLLTNDDGKPVTEMKMIQLPKWQGEAEPPLFFKILGYAEIVNSDTFRLQDLLLDYSITDSLYNFTDGYRVTGDSAIWKWEWKRGAPIVENTYIVPYLGDKEIAVVFSINKPATYIKSLNPSNLGLYDSKNQKLSLVAFDQPIERLSGLLTRGGTNGDTIYYARMVSGASPKTLPSPASTPVYYRLVIEDSIKSDFASHTIQLFPYSATPGAFGVIDNNNTSVHPTSGPPDTFDVQRNTLHSVVFYGAAYYDYYITNDSAASVVWSGNTSSTVDNYKKFNVTAPNYTFPLSIRKLQVNGAIYLDTIIIRSSP